MCSLTPDIGGSSGFCIASVGSIQNATNRGPGICAHCLSSARRAWACSTWSCDCKLIYRSRSVIRGCHRPWRSIPRSASPPTPVGSPTPVSRRSVISRSQSGWACRASCLPPVGIAAAMALVRGLARRGTGRVGNFWVGNFWVDITRSCTRLVLPIAAVAALVLLLAGVIQSWQHPDVLTTLSGGQQTVLGGPVASWEPVKLMTGDGGGAFNANSAHPFENPSWLTNVFEIYLMLLLPSVFPRAYGRMVGDRRQGWALAAVVAVILLGSITAAAAAQSGAHGPVPVAVGAATEGTEVRNGVVASAVFGVAATASADGAADSSYDSFTGLGGGILMANMMLGEVSPGGSGSGLYGLLIVALLAVFLGGLMIGRTPEFLKKRLGAREMKLVSLIILTAPIAVLIGTGI